MSNSLRFFSIAAAVAIITLTPTLDAVDGAQAQAPGDGSSQGTKPTPNPCAKYLTSRPNATIVMGPNKKKGEALVSVPAVEPKLVPQPQCQRWVVEVTVPSNASSGCADCYPWAEINAGLGEFPNSSEFEEHFYRPSSSAGENFCKSYRHDVAVYKKASGASTFGSKPLKQFIYRGDWETGMCRVKASFLGQVHDTSEVYAPINPPKSGTDRYRVVHAGVVDGLFRKVKVVVEYEPKRR